MRTWLNVLLILLILHLASCASEIPKSTGTYLPAIDGPKSKIDVPLAALEAATEVRLYVYDFGECNDFNVFQKTGERNLVADGVRLSDNQLRALKPLIPQRILEQGMSLCFNPHHAIAWFDKAGKQLGAAEVCFECESVQLQIGSQQFAYMPDMERYRDLFESFGAPISLKRTCTRQGFLQAPWSVPVAQICALNAIRLQAKKSLPKNWKAQQQNEYQKSCVRSTREVIF
jgi:hypothetical protein